MVASLQERIQRDARFASDVSHELRSPLTTLRSAVEVMEHRQAALDGISFRALTLLTKEVTRFEGLVEDLLEISRYDAGAAVLELVPVDLVALVRQVLDEHGQPAAVRTVMPSPVIVDRRRTEQALRNIVANAVLHADGVVATTVAVGRQWTTIAVEDRGPGIDQADRATIFERFSRGRNAGHRASGEGVGLGLSLAAEHVQLQGGAVTAEPAAPQGSVFTVRLPTRWP